MKESAYWLNPHGFLSLIFTQPSCLCARGVTLHGECAPKVLLCTRDTFWFHYQRSLSLPRSSTETLVQGVSVGPVLVSQLSVWGSISSPLFRSAVSVGFCSLVLTPFLIIPPSLKLDSRSSAQCLAVGVYFCFHQLLDEVSVMAYKVVTPTNNKSNSGKATLNALP